LKAYLVLIIIMPTGHTKNMGCNGQWKTVFFTKGRRTEDSIRIERDSLPSGVLAVKEVAILRHAMDRLCQQRYCFDLELI
jgi:hypothetical protein